MFEILKISFNNYHIKLCLNNMFDKELKAYFSLVRILKNDYVKKKLQSAIKKNVLIRAQQKHTQSQTSENEIYLLTQL